MITKTQNSNDATMINDHEILVITLTSLRHSWGCRSCRIAYETNYQTEEGAWSGAIEHAYGGVPWFRKND